MCVCRKGNARRTSFFSNVWYQKLVLLFGVLGRRKIKKATALDRIGCPYWWTMSGDIVVGKVIGMLIDLNKAFDAIPHDIKMNNVKCYGIRRVECPKWFKKNIVGNIAMGESQSLCLDTAYGVSTWSTLFILHINNIFKTSHQIKFKFGNYSDIVECDEKCK